MNPPPWKGTFPNSLCPGTMAHRRVLPLASLSLLLVPAVQGHLPCGMGAREHGCPGSGCVPRWGAQLCSDRLGSIARAGAYFKGELSSEPKPEGAVARGLQSATGGCCNPPLGAREAPAIRVPSTASPCPWGSAVPLRCYLAQCWQHTHDCMCTALPRTPQPQYACAHTHRDTQHPCKHPPTQRCVHAQPPVTPPLPPAPSAHPAFPCTTSGFIA